MAVSLILTGSGSVGEIMPGWSVTEEATPVAPGDLSGGTGSVGLNVAQGEDSEFVINNLSTFTHDRLGSIDGKVSTATSNGATEETDTTIPLSLTTTFTQLAAERTAPPIWLDDESAPDFLNPSSTALGPVASTVNRAGAIAVNPNTGDVYVTSQADYVDDPGGPVDRRRVLRYDSAGNYLSEWGGLGTTDGLFSHWPPPSYALGGPSGIAINPLNNNVYVVDFGPDSTGVSNQRVQIFTASGTFVGKFGSFGTGNGQFGYTANAPIAISPVDGSVYVVDIANNRVQKFTSTGTYVAQVAFPVGYNSVGYSLLTDIAVDSTGKVYVSFSLQNFPGTTQPGYSSIWVYNSSLVQQSMIPFNIYPTPTANYGSFPGYNAVVIGGNDEVWAYAGGTNYVVQIDSTSGMPVSYVYSRNTSKPGANDRYDFGYNPINDGIYLLWMPQSLNDSISGNRKRVENFAYMPRTLSTAIRAYIDLINPAIVLDYTLPSDPYVLFPGWKDSVWNKLKELGAAYEFQIDCIENNLVVSELGGRTISLDDVQKGTASLTLDSRSTGRSIDITYQNTSGGSGIVYNAIDSGKVFSVGVGETVNETVQVKSYPLVLNTPTQTSVFPPLPGQYYVTAADNLPVVPAQWEAYGGSVSVAIGDSPGTIDVTLTGPRTAIPGVTGPYSLSVSDGSTSYPALSITGSGVFTNPVVLNLLTGSDPAKTPVEIAQSIDNFAIRTLEQAYDRGIWASVIASGPVLTLSCTVPTSQISEYGLGQGSLVSYKESKYRVTTAVIGSVWTTLTATRHTTVADFDAVWSGRTVGQHDPLWTGNDCSDQFIKPFRQ